MKITVTDVKGKPLVLEGKKVGPFLVHPATVQYWEKGSEYEKWAITHIITGLQIPKLTASYGAGFMSSAEIHFSDESFATEVAEHFSDHPFYTAKAKLELTKDQVSALRGEHLALEHEIQDRRHTEAETAKAERRQRREAAFIARREAGKEAARKGQAVTVPGKWGMEKETIPIEKRFGKLAVHRGPERMRSWWRVTHIPSNVSIAESKSKRKAMAFAKEAARTLDLNWKQLKRLSKKRKDALKAAAAGLSKQHGMG